MATGVSFFFRCARFAPPFALTFTFPAFLRLASFAGHCMFRQRTHGGRPRELTLITGWPHDLQRSSVRTLRPRCRSGRELLQGGELHLPADHLPECPARL